MIIHNYEEYYNRLIEEFKEFDSPAEEYDDDSDDDCSDMIPEDILRKVIEEYNLDHPNK